MYLAASMRFVSGNVPYRDFSFFMPPGILLVMSPVAILSRIFGSHDGYWIARLFSSLVTAFNSCLLAWLVRTHGRAVMLTSGVLLSAFPATMFVSSALKLEPYYMFLVLLGSVVIFAPKDGTHALSNRSLALGGILFGLAALIKLWAFFPFVAAIICLVPRYRGRVLFLVAGASCSFTLCALPFIVSAPGRFVTQVIFDQLGKTGNFRSTLGSIWRLNGVMGLSAFSLYTPRHVTVALGIVLVAVFAIGAFQRPRYLVVDSYLLVALATCTTGLLIAPQTFSYYGYFTAPLFIGILVVSVSRLKSPINQWLSLLGVSGTLRRLIRKCSLIVVGFVLVVMSVSFERNYSYIALSSGMSVNYLSPVTRTIPRGACVVFNQAFLAVYSNRLLSSSPSCPDLVDPTGLWFTSVHGRAAPSPVFIAQWKSYLQAANFVVLNVPRSTVIPWDRTLRLWFRDHFHLVSAQPWIYAKTTSS